MPFQKIPEISAHSSTADLASESFAGFVSLELTEKGAALRTKAEFSLLKDCLETSARHGFIQLGFSTKGWNALGRIWHYRTAETLPDVGAGGGHGDPDPYLQPKAYFDDISQALFEYWEVMAAHGEYAQLVKLGADPSLRKHLETLQSGNLKSSSYDIPEGMSGELAALVAGLHEVIFAVYREEMTSLEDFLHHLPGEEFSLFESFYAPVPTEHQRAFELHNSREEFGIAVESATWLREAQKRLGRLEEEAAICRARFLNKDSALPAEGPVE